MTTQEFSAKMAADNQHLVDRMQACKTPEEAYALAKGEGLTDTFDTFTAEMTKLYESVKDLSDDDLENVAGGLSNPQPLTDKMPVSNIAITGGTAQAAQTASV